MIAELLRDVTVQMLLLALPAGVFLGTALVGVRDEVRQEPVPVPKVAPSTRAATVLITPQT